jgi:hypothetical protein
MLTWRVFFENYSFLLLINNIFIFIAKNAETDSNDLIAMKLKLKQQLEQKLFEKTETPVAGVKESDKPAMIKQGTCSPEINSSHHDSQDDEHNQSLPSNLSSMSDSNENKETVTKKESSKHPDKKRKKDNKKHGKGHHHHSEKKLQLSSKKKQQLEEDELNLVMRRSARIQIIEVQRQYTKEQQIAEKIKKHANNSSNTSVSCQQDFLNDHNSNNSESQPALTTMSSSQDLFAAGGENDPATSQQQPAMKVKERWRRFSEKENDSTQLSASNAACSQSMQDLTMSPK